VLSDGFLCGELGIQLLHLRLPEPERQKISNTARSSAWKGSLASFFVSCGAVLYEVAIESEIGTYLPNLLVCEVEKIITLLCCGASSKTFFPVQTKWG